MLSNIVRRHNVAMTLTGVFAMLALLLAGLGVYGMMSYNVLARTREFGIRSALGASRAAVLGLVLAAVLLRLAASLLVGTTAHDPASNVAAMVILVEKANGKSDDVRGNSLFPFGSSTRRFHSLFPFDLSSRSFH